jgi:hypothetical protein
MDELDDGIAGHDSALHGTPTKMQRWFAIAAIFKTCGEVYHVDIGFETTRNLNFNQRKSS